MNVIEERIRAAARAAADTVAPDSVPPLELPAPRPRRLGRWLRAARSPGATRTPWAARLTPWAAALAVIAIVITTVTLSPPAHQGGLGHPTATASRPDVPLGPPVSTDVRSVYPKLLGQVVERSPEAREGPVAAVVGEADA